MTKHPDNSAEDEGRHPEDPQEPFDELDERIQEGLQFDPRLDSGVAPSERGGDLDFIQMSGLTAPPPAPQETPLPEESEDHSDLDPGKPLSFYEEGVADVDSSMIPAVEDESTSAREYPAELDNRAAMEHLRDMIAELTRDESPVAEPAFAEGESVPLEPAHSSPEFEDAFDVGVMPEEEPEFVVSEEPPPEDESIELAPRIQEQAPDEPIAEEPVAEEPVAEELVAEEPVAEVPVAEVPVAEEPVAEEPPAEEPPAEEPPAEEPPAEEPPAEEPPAEEPPAEEPPAPRKPFELTPRAEVPTSPVPERETTEAVPSWGIDVGQPESSFEPSTAEEFAESAGLSGVAKPDFPEVREEPEPVAMDAPRVPRVYTPPPSKPQRGGLKPEPPAAQVESGDRVQIRTVAEAEEAMYLRHNAPRTRRRRSGHKKHARRRVIRIAAGFIVLATLAAGGYRIHAWYEANVSNPTTLYNQAVSLAAQENYREASAKFAAFAQRNPGSVLRADAQFSAAFNLQLIQPASQDEVTRVYSQSLELFQAFLDEFPTHVKAPRARTLMGRLHFELGQYQEAIELLRDPELRLLDPIAAVPAVRLLARSYAKLGQDDSARSYYLQAVGLQDNHTPDVDYVELGTLYRTMAERASVSTARREYEQLAIAQWTHAVQSPGIDPAAKKELRAKIDVLRERGLQDGAAETIEPEAQSETESIDPAAAAFSENPPWESLAPALDEDAGAVEDEYGMEPSAEIAEENDPPVQLDSTLVETAATAEDDSPEMVEGAPPTEVIHHVVAGDTLSAIAAAHGVSVAELMEWNELTQSIILVGQELIVHGPKSQASDPSESVGENEEDNRESTS